MVRAMLRFCAWAILATRAVADAGDLIANVPLPVNGNGVSVAVDCDGNVYFTHIPGNNLYVMNKTGALLATHQMTDVVTGAAVEMDEMSFDAGRGVLWACQHGTNPVAIWHVDPATGAATFQWLSATIS